MRNTKRIGALILFFCLSLIMSVSLAFIAFEAGHDCCGEDCPICRTIAMTTALMRALCLIAAAQLMWSVLAVSRSAFHIPGLVRLHAEGTPVSRKTRIND